MKTKLIAIVSAILIIAGVGCSTSLSYLITPAPKDKGAIKYVTKAGVAEPNEYKGYFNLDKAMKLNKDVEIAHTFNKEKLTQALEREETIHSILASVTKENYKIGQAREDALFGPTGILSLGMTLMGVSGAGVLGLMRKRPKDMDPEEVSNAIREAVGNKDQELSEKDKQFLQLVKGVQSFMKIQKTTDNSDALELVANLKKAAQDSGNAEAIKSADELAKYVGSMNGDVILSLKNAMNLYQDEKTRTAVAAAKSSVVV